MAGRIDTLLCARCLGVIGPGDPVSYVDWDEDHRDWHPSGSPRCTGCTEPTADLYRVECRACGRPKFTLYKTIAACSQRCAKRLRRRKARTATGCLVCGAGLDAGRSDTRYCSVAHRVAAWRRRRGSRAPGARPEPARPRVSDRKSDTSRNTPGLLPAGNGGIRTVVGTMPDPSTGDPKAELRRIRTVVRKLARIGIEIGARYVPKTIHASWSGAVLQGPGWQLTKLLEPFALVFAIGLTGDEAVKLLEDLLVHPDAPRLANVR